MSDVITDGVVSGWLVAGWLEELLPERRRKRRTVLLYVCVSVIYSSLKRTVVWYLIQIN